MSKIKTIDLESHYSIKLMLEEYMKEIRNDPSFQTYLEANAEGFAEKMKRDEDVGEYRLSLMDEAGVDFSQLMLTTPGPEFFGGELAKKIAKEGNDKIAEAIQYNPDRLGGYIALPVDDVDWAISEIDRCVDLGLWGWGTFSNYVTDRLDDPKYWPILEKCNELNMPIYIHPNFPTSPEINEFGYALNGPAFGFTFDTQHTFLRMLCRGVFDEYPNLKMILGHDAEGLAFYIDRVNSAYRQGYGQPPKEIGHFEEEPGYYISQNLYGSTSGNFSNEAMRFTYEVLGHDNLTCGTDFPYEVYKPSIDMIKDDEILTKADKEKILYKNAEALGFGKKRI